MRNIHWIGAGLSSTFGIDELIAHPKGCLHLWMRDPSKAASRWKESAQVSIHQYDLDRLGAVLSKGDIVVSMLPFTMHLSLAQIALARGAHFVCSSYLSPALLELDESARAKGVIVAGEMGLDPGIDHMLAHELVRRYQKDKKNIEEDHTVSFLSLCGGIPESPGPFCYQFSWSPVGILRALRQASTWLEEGEPRTVAAPYQAVKTLRIRGEEFEYYPNRDSLPFIDYYRLPKDRLKHFLRGSIRSQGWQKAWRDIFHHLPELSEEGLQALSQELYGKYSYKDNERDRVVMFIAIDVKNRLGEIVRTYSAYLDATGNENHHAMTTLVCLPLLTVIEGILEGRYAPGILRPIASNQELDRWLQMMALRQIEVQFVTTERI